MHVFGMVTTQHSNAYTDYALSSLVAHTKLDAEDEIVLIDNDGVYSGPPEDCRDRVRVHVNTSPRSFAANLNQTIEWATPRQADVVFLNNDMVFSPGWFEPLRRSGQSLMSPLSNGEVQHSKGRLECTMTMELEDYLGKEKLFAAIARQHRKQAKGFLKVLSFPFFAVKIPYRVYSTVGLLDESFGRGGGEDKDYSVRCYQAGFDLRFMLTSYILHFQGKSTWRGAETREETAARDRHYSDRFREKWGAGVYDLLVMHEEEQLASPLKPAYAAGDYKTVIEGLVVR